MIAGPRVDPDIETPFANAQLSSLGFINGRTGSGI
jgi:hypothetical protein